MLSQHSCCQSPHPVAEYLRTASPCFMQGYFAPKPESNSYPCFLSEDLIRACMLHLEGMLQSRFDIAPSVVCAAGSARDSMSVYGCVLACIVVDVCLPCAHVSQHLRVGCPKPCRTYAANFQAHITAAHLRLISHAWRVNVMCCWQGAIEDFHVDALKL